MIAGRATYHDRPLPVGQIVSIYRNAIRLKSSLSRKNILFPFFVKIWFSPVIPPPPGGAYRGRHGRWKRGAVAVRVFSASCVDESILADGEVVRSRSPDAGIKSAGDEPAGDGG